MFKEAEIDFLFFKLQSVLKKSLLGKKNGIITRNSLSTVKETYDRKISAPLAGKDENLQKIKLVTSEVLVDIFRDHVIADESTIYKLAALVLLIEKETEVKQCIQEIVHKTSWNTFLKVYKQEFLYFILKETYILYYWKGNNVHIAQVSFQLNESKNEWVDCKIVYYDNVEGKFTECKLDYKVVIIPKTAQTTNNAFSLYVYYEYQITQITISIPFSDIQNQKVFFCNYTTHNKEGHLYSGIAVLKKYADINKKLNEIINLNIIDDDIYNFLYEKTNNIKSDTYNINELPNAKDITELNKLKGIWKVSYLRNTKPSHSIAKDKGGIKQNYLKIEASGKILFKTNANNVAGYQGFITYPIIDNVKFIKIKIYPLTAAKSYRINMFLDINEDKNIMEGVIAGWSERAKPFGSLVRIEKILKVKEEETYFKKVKPVFYPKKNFVGVNEVSDASLTFFRNNRKLLDIAEDCLPDFVEGNKEFLKKLAGFFYVISRDYAEGMFDKAKLKIFENGEFHIDYMDVSYKGIVKEFVSVNSSDKYIYLNILYKMSDNIEWSKFAGGLLFNIPKDFISKNKPDGLLQNAKTPIIGLSLRKNAKGDIQSKKEILILAENLSQFEEEKPEKHAYTNEAILKNLKIKKDDEYLNIEHYKLIIKNLRGQENNIMLITNDVTSKSIRENNYFEIYMNAFLFDVIFSKKVNYYKLSIYLLQSLLHLDDGSKLGDKIQVILNKKSFKINLPASFFNRMNQLYDLVIKKGKDEELSNYLQNLKSLRNVQEDNSQISKSVYSLIQQIRKSIK